MPKLNCIRKQKVENPIIIHPATSKDDINTRLRGQFIRQFIHIVIIFTIDVGIPLALYFVLISHLPPVWALLVSGAPNAIFAPLRYLFTRSVDTFGLLVFAGFCISAVLAAISNDPRLLLIRESLLTSILAVAFLVSLIPIRIRRWRMKPLMFLLAKQILAFPPVQFQDDTGRYGDSTAMTENVYDWQWRSRPRFRKMIRIITFIWSIGLTFEFIGRLVLVFVVQTLTTVVVWSNVLIAFWLGLLVIISVFFARKIRKMAVADLVNVYKVKTKKLQEKNGTSTSEERMASEDEPSSTNNSDPESIA